MESFRPTSVVSRSRTTSGVDNKEVQDVLVGSLSAHHSPLSRTIRIYVSSEWADSLIEREYLFSHVIPYLCQFCQTLSLQFHAVDLFSVVPVSFNDAKCTGNGTSDKGSCHVNNALALYELERQGTLSLISKEIELCQRVSAGPNFVTLLAQKYGYKALWHSIPREDFALLLAAVEDVASKELIQSWYKLNTNARPQEYVLQSSKDTGVSLEEWVIIHESLSKEIRRAAKVALGKAVSKVQHYTMSVMEEEVTVGIFNLNENPNQYCLWFKRIFSDLIEQRPSADSALCLYTDLAMGRKGLEFDMETMKTLNHLKEARMPAKYIGLDTTNIIEFSLKWQKNKGLDPAENPTHSEYLSDLAESVQSSLIQMIAATADIMEVQSGSPVYQETLCHGQYCKDRAKSLWDRPNITSQVYKYITSESNVPLVIHGVTGSGKTSIMAGVAYHIKEKYPLIKMILVIRFIGITPSSSSIRCTLRSICEQLSVVFKEDATDIPGDYKSITKRFEMLLTKATEENPLYLFLDGVDQLSPEDGASGMSWLPLSLPPNVKIILSTTSEVQYRCFPVLQSLLSENQQSFIQISLLSNSERRDFLRHALASQGRQLTITQEEKALKASALCPLPLYIMLLMRDFQRWHSYDHSTWENPPPDSLEGLCQRFITSVEEELGHCFVSRALGYITAAKYGLSEVELLDILASDREVVALLKQEWRSRYPSTVEDSTPFYVLQIPPLLWSHFYHTLSPYLELRMGIGQVLVYRWSCRLLKDVATKLFLDSEEKRATEIFMLLADYFNGILMKANETVNSPSNTSCLTEQPLMLNEEKQLWNVRKLTELPYCLARCEKTDELKQLLTDYNWLKACVRTTPCADIINWFSDVIPVVPLGRNDHDSAESDELRLLRDALSLSIPSLTLDPTQLSTQLLSRLMPYITGSETERSVLKQLVITALEDFPPVITPLHPSFNLPGGPLLVTMEGHRDVVSCIATVMTRNRETGTHEVCILSSSWDRTLKTWDLNSTGVMKTFDGHTERVLSAALTCNAQYAASGSADKTVRHWCVSTGKCLHTMTGHTASVNAVLISSDGSKTISGSSDTTVRVWNTDPASSSYGQLIYTMKHSKSPVLSMCWYGALSVAIGYKDGGIYTTNIVSAEVLQTFQEHSGGITTLAYMELEDRCRYLISGSDSGSMMIRQSDTGQTLHTINLDTGPVRNISVASNGKITAAYGDRMVSVWDLLSGSHLFDLSTEHSTTTNSTSMADEGNLAITGSADSCIRIWDLKSPPVSQTSKFHDGDTLTVTISPCGLYAISGGADLSIKVYNLDTMDVLKQLHGHQGAVNHVVVMRDSKHLLSASSDGSVCLWNGESEEIIRTFHDEKNSSQVNCIAVSADSELLMSGNEDGQVIFWSVKTGKLLKTFTNHKSAIISVAFAQSSTTKYIMSASRDGQVFTRDFYTAKILLSKQTHIDDLLCLTVSRDASVYATGSKDRECHVISLPSGSLMSVLTGHKGSVRSVKILQAGKLCITVSEDCTLRLWDVSQSECMATLHADIPILSCDLDRHDATIVYGTKDGWVSTALYHDGSTGDNTQHNPMLRKLKGIESPSSSSFAETDSSRSSKVMNTGQEIELQLHVPSKNMIDASSIPLPPSDDDGSSLENKSTCSQTSSVVWLPQQNQDQDIQDIGVTSTPTASTTAIEKLLPEAITEHDGTTNSQKQLFEKLIPDVNGFVEPDISKILKIKSDVTSNGYESVHDEDMVSESGKSKTSLPTSSSACTLL